MEQLIKNPRKPVALIVRGLPRDLRETFSGFCRGRGRTMTGLIRAVMKDATSAPGTPKVIDFHKLSTTYKEPK